MEPPTPIYLQSCRDCGRPALTLDEEGAARCAEHAKAFIPAGESSREPDAVIEER